MMTGLRPARGAGILPPRPQLEAAVRDLIRPRVPPGRDGGWVRSALATIDRGGIHVLTRDMPQYPDAFLELPDPPRVVFAIGRLEILRTPMVAVVGTRSCTGSGREAAARIARGIAAAGVTVVSGLALGIDGAAHQAAGASRTVAILGCGVDVAYPPRHRDLQREIARAGLLLSEQPPGAPAIGFHFPMRNRMIAALASGVVVVEAPHRSGALRTVEHALRLSRPIFVVPGPLGERAAAGSNELIHDGAMLVTTAREVLDELDLPLPPDDFEEDVPPPDLSGVGLALWRSLGAGPRHVDELTAELGLPAHQGLASLLALEVQGYARQLPGMRFVRD
jgi:DNA processing protein